MLSFTAGNLKKRCEWCRCLFSFQNERHRIISRAKWLVDAERLGPNKTKYKKLVKQSFVICGKCWATKKQMR